MAELTSEPTPATSSPSSCCSSDAQASCCEPAAKEECCASGCGCSAADDGADAGQEVRETVRERYAAAARAVVEQQRSASCCGPVSVSGADETHVFGAALYGDSESSGAPAGAVAASLGCGVPTAVADLNEGETVLDLGSGAGADVLISARRVGARGRAIGLDMTNEMLELARRNAAEAGVANVEFVKGYIEEIPLADASVDVIVSNCVLNLSGDKPRVFAEAARVLRPGGRFAVSDVIADPGMDEQTRADMAQWTGCIAGALTAQEFRAGLAAAGFTPIEIRPTHQVHEFASAAIIRARKPEQPAVPATTRQTTETSTVVGTLNVTHVGSDAVTMRAAHRLELFEPAMCCETGVCGPSVDQALIEIREDLRWARQHGAEVSRHNLSSDPDAFVANPKVTGLMAAFGEKALPALLLDGEIVLHGSYPTRSELVGFLDATPQPVEVSAGSGGGCGCGSSGCC